MVISRQSYVIQRHFAAILRYRNELIREIAVRRGEGASAPELELDPKAPMWTGRRTELAHAIEALLANAREASPPGGPIRVLQKPFTPDRLVERVREILDSNRR